MKKTTLIKHQSVVDKYKLDPTRLRRLFELMPNLDATLPRAGTHRRFASEDEAHSVARITMLMDIYRPEVFIHADREYSAEAIKRAPLNYIFLSAKALGVKRTQTIKKHAKETKTRAV